MAGAEPGAADFAGLLMELGMRGRVYYLVISRRCMHSAELQAYWSTKLKGFEVGGIV